MIEPPACVLFTIGVAIMLVAAEKEGLAMVRNDRDIGDLPREWWAKCILAGLIGGGAMILYLMGSFASRGAWFPVNAIGATLPAFRPFGYSIPPSGAFVPGPSLFGLGVHFVLSALWAVLLGIALAAFVPGHVRSPLWATLGGLLWGALLWVFSGLMLVRALDPFVVVNLASTSQYLIGHLIYGVVTAWVIALTARRQDLTIMFAPEERPVARKP
jgi:hypothetical protein